MRISDWSSDGSSDLGDALSDLFFGTAVPGRRKDSTMNTMSRPDLPVVVIGAGPVSLAAAAHLVERGLRPLVLERGKSVGAALLDWGHVQIGRASCRGRVCQDV